MTFLENFITIITFVFGPDTLQNFVYLTCRIIYMSTPEVRPTPPKGMALQP